ncbi:hypothetical protein LINPERPRIM_LOCUS2560, partial [Linum perenne]
RATQRSNRWSARFVCRNSKRRRYDGLCRSVSTAFTPSELTCGSILTPPVLSAARWWRLPHRRNQGCRLWSSMTFRPKVCSCSLVWKAIHGEIRSHYMVLNADGLKSMPESRLCSELFPCEY